MVLAAIGDPFRFSNGSQLLKFVGLDLTAQRSGKKSTNITTSISKRGKSEVRYALYHAALVASSKNEHFVRYFTDKIRNRAKEKGRKCIKTKMPVKLSAKTLQIAWALIKKRVNTQLLDFKRKFSPKKFSLTGDYRMFPTTMTKLSQ